MAERVIKPLGYPTLLREITAQVFEVCRHTAGAIRKEACAVFVPQCQCECFRNLERNLVLHGENVVEHEPLVQRPDVGAVGCADQLRNDAQVIANTLHTALEQIMDIEFLANRRRVHACLAERE